MEKIKQLFSQFWLIILLVALGSLSYFYYQNTDKSAPVQDEEVAQVGNTYINDKFGFRFKYPLEYTTKVLKTDFEGNASTVEFFDKNGMRVFELSTPPREIGMEFLSKSNESEVIQTKVGSIIKDIFKDNQYPSMVYVRLMWNEKNWYKAGEIWFSYKISDAQKITDLNMIISSFEFTT